MSCLCRRSASVTIHVLSEGSGPQPRLRGPDSLLVHYAVGVRVDVRGLLRQRKVNQISKARLCTAVLMVFCLRLASMELLIPDVHDGDASSAASTPATADTSPPSADEVSAPFSGPLHPHHVDHCTHGHADGVPATMELSFRSVELVDVPPSLESPSSSPEASPPYQPPKA
jgi:hypothetical protein